MYAQQTTQQQQIPYQQYQNYASQQQSNQNFAASLNEYAQMPSLSQIPIINAQSSQN